MTSSSSSSTSTIMEPGVLAAMENVRSGANKAGLMDIRHCIDYNEMTRQMHMVEQQISRQMEEQAQENHHHDNDDAQDNADDNHEQEGEEETQEQQQQERDHHAMMMMLMREQRERTRPRRLDCAHVQQIVQFLKEHNSSSDDDDDDDDNNKESSSTRSNNVTSLSIHQYLMSGDDDEEDNVKALETLRDYFVQGGKSEDDESNTTDVITTVNLSFCKFGNAGAKRLVPAFHNTQVTSLSWQGNDIRGDDEGDDDDDDGGDVLEQLLTENEVLCHLKLADNHQLGVTGAAGLGRGLSRNTALEHLNLTYCKIGSAGVALLLPPPFEDEENEASMTTASTNDSLKDLDLSWNGITGEEGGENLGNLLPRLTQLQRLNMTMNALGSPGAQALGPGLIRHETLQKLVLSNCDLGSDGVGLLIPSGQSNSSVEHLVLERNGIEGQEGGANLAAVVQRFQNLKKLSLQGNPLGPDGAKAFALGLQPQSQGVGSGSNSQSKPVFFELLDMSECQLGDDGVAWMAKICIGRLDNVRHWNIFRNDITSLGLDVLTRHILKVVHHLEVLDIFCNPQLLQDLSVVATFCDTLASMGHDTTAAMTTPCRLRQLDMRGCMTRTASDDDDDEEQEAFTAVETKLMSACQRNSTLDTVAMAMNADNRERLNGYLKRNYFLKHANRMAQKAAALTDDDKKAVSPHVMYWAWNEIRQRDQGASAAFHLFRNVLLCPP